MNRLQEIRSEARIDSTKKEAIERARRIADEVSRKEVERIFTDTPAIENASRNLWTDIYNPGHLFYYLVEDLRNALTEFCEPGDVYEYLNSEAGTNVSAAIDRIDLLKIVPVIWFSPADDEDEIDDLRSYAYSTLKKLLMEFYSSAVDQFISSGGVEDWAEALGADE